jgi:hypothetical protein
MYARFEKLARELSSSDEGSDDDTAGAADAAGAAARRVAAPESLPGGRAPAKRAGPTDGHTSSAAFESVKAHCIALMDASDAASRDAALAGITTVFSSLDRAEAEGLAQFALMPVMLLLRDMGKPGHDRVAAVPPLSVHKERGIEQALAAMCAVVKAGGARRDEVHSTCQWGGGCALLPPENSAPFNSRPVP